MKVNPILFNKLTLSMSFGLATTLLLVWYDSTMTIEMVTQRGPLEVVIIFISAAILGFGGGVSIPSMVRYHIASDAMVIGFPFPSVFLERERDEEGSDASWIDFPWGQGFFLNMIYWALVFVAGIFWLIDKLHMEILLPFRRSYGRCMNKRLFAQGGIVELTETL